MDDFINNSEVSVSIIDYIGKIEDGVGLLLNILAGEESYEIGYWFNSNGDIILTPEEKLLNKLGVDDINNYQYINELIYFIHHNIPNTELILKEFI